MTNPYEELEDMRQNTGGYEDDLEFSDYGRDGSKAGKVAMFALAFVVSWGAAVGICAVAVSLAIRWVYPVLVKFLQ